METIIGKPLFLSASMKQARRASSFYVGVGTREGGYLLASDFERKKWKKIGPFLKRESVNSLTYNPKLHRIFAATHTEGVFVSDDLGKTWKQSNKGLHVRKTWTIEHDPKDPKKVLVGTHYGHLFRSYDAGDEWEEVAGLFTAPKRSDWGIDWAFGTVGLCIHTIRFDPTRKGRFYIISSGGGPYRTDDDGKTWKLLNSGVIESCPVGGGERSPGIPDEGAKRLSEHLNQVHKCTHKLVLSKSNPERLYQQNHCGFYSSSDSGESWQDNSASNDLRHGFPLVLTKNHSESLFAVPAFQGICKEHNSCIMEGLAVYRSSDGAKSWEKLANGLPRKVHTCVLRDAMCTDDQDPAGVYFGTTTGEIYGSIDNGDSWNLLFENLGRIQGVSSFTA